MKAGAKEVCEGLIMSKDFALALKYATRFLQTLKKVDGMNRSIFRMFKRQSGACNGGE